MMAVRASLGRPASASASYESPHNAHATQSECSSGDFFDALSFAGSEATSFFSARAAGSSVCGGELDSPCSMISDRMPVRDCGAPLPLPWGEEETGGGPCSIASGHMSMRDCGLPLPLPWGEEETRDDPPPASHDPREGRSKLGATVYGSPPCGGGTHAEASPMVNFLCMPPLGYSLVVGNLMANHPQSPCASPSPAAKAQMRASSSSGPGLRPMPAPTPPSATSQPGALLHAQLVPLSDGTLRLLLRPQKHQQQRQQRPPIQVSFLSPTAVVRAPIDSADAAIRESGGASLRHSAVRRWLSAGGSDSVECMDGGGDCTDDDVIGSDTHGTGAMSARDQAYADTGGLAASAAAGGVRKAHGGGGDGGIEGCAAAGGGKAGLFPSESQAMAAGRARVHAGSSGGGDVADDQARLSMHQQHAHAAAAASAAAAAVCAAAAASNTWQVYNVMLPPELCVSEHDAGLGPGAAAATRASSMLSMAPAALKLGGIGATGPAVAAPDATGGDDAAMHVGGAGAAGGVCTHDGLGAADAPEEVVRWAGGEGQAFGEEADGKAQTQAQTQAQEQAWTQVQQEQQAHQEEAGVLLAAQQEQQLQRAALAQWAVAASASVRTLEGIVRLMIPAFQRERAYAVAVPLPPMAKQEAGSRASLAVQQQGSSAVAPLLLPVEPAAPPQACSHPGEVQQQQGYVAAAGCSDASMHNGTGGEAAGKHTAGAAAALQAASPRQLSQAGGMQGGGGGVGFAAEAPRAQRRPSLIKRLLRPCLCPSADTWELECAGRAL
ncbi:hypothetical protein FOA52_006803 [Chlamydomonas sp. UWO 241]|nr:hypothetical protein FOA52_006803 [Chlamydomonas sp. UWO 241]